LVVLNNFPKMKVLKNRLLLPDKQVIYQWNPV
jgi:hypothetical protein